MSHTVKQLPISYAAIGILIVFSTCLAFGPNTLLAQNRPIPNPQAGRVIVDSKPKIDPLLIGRLPQFCLANYVSTGNPAHRIPKECGTWMNHYCEGVVELLESGNPMLESGQRGALLRRARKHTAYTLEHMEPACPIASHVQNTASIIEVRLRSLVTITGKPLDKAGGGR